MGSVGLSRLDQSIDDHKGDRQGNQDAQHKAGYKGE